MKRKHQRTLNSIFQDPILANIVWMDIESMFTALGAIIRERKGSKVGVYLNDRVAIFHRPHPQKETDRGAVKSVRLFLIETGVTLED